MEAWLKPMLCQDGGAIEALPTGDEWIYERKLDGWRGMFHVTAKGVKLYGGRNGTDYTGKLPYIEAVLTRLPEDTVLDGEIIAPAGWGSVQQAMRRNGEHNLDLSDPLKFMAFDVTRVAGQDVRTLAWTERRAMLEAANLNGPLVKTSKVEVADPSMHELFLNDGYEGTVAKRIDAKYVGTRSPWWLKFKPTCTVDAVVTGMIEGEGHLVGHMGALEVEILDSGVKAKVGGGFDDPTRLDIFRKWGQTPDSIEGKVIEIKCQEVGASGVPRFPRFARLRDDLNTPAPAPTPAAPRASRPRNGPSPRNYGQMGAKFAGVLAELRAGVGEAAERAEHKHTGLANELRLAEAEAKKRGIA